MIITEIQYFFSKIIRFQAIFKDTVEFTCALEFKISSQHFLFRDLLFRDLLFRKSSTGGLSAVAGSAALDIHMIRHTLVIAVINTFYRLTVDADRMAWMRQGIAERFSSLSLLRKALTAGAVTVTGVLAAHHDVSLAAQTVLIIGTIFHNAF